MYSAAVFLCVVYFVGKRLFELSELKLLADAVESSRFITAKKSERLIEKLGKLTSESHARQLDRHIYMEGTVKAAVGMIKSDCTS